MKIRVLPRVFFEKVKGTPTEVELLEKSKIISINSSGGFDEAPPFSEKYLKHPYLLTLNFDDVCNEPETPEDLSNVILFNKDMAHAIIRFVDDGKLPLLVHCTAGISRSGAVGEVLTGTSTAIWKPTLPTMKILCRTTAKSNPIPSSEE